MAYTALISDFDNTLYDWFDMWQASFTSLLNEVEHISGISKDVLIPEIRAIHQRYHTSEYAFLIEKIPSLQKKFPGENLVQKFDEAIHKYRSARKNTLRLYDGVLDTLLWLKQNSVPIILYTESLKYYTNSRIRVLGLDGVVDVVYSPDDHEVPSYISEDEYKQLTEERFGLKFTTHRNVPRGVIKPNPEVLLDIISDQGLDKSRCVYVGDSLMKDVAMAQAAGVTDVLAEYGASQSHPQYPLLRLVSHWTEEDVQREKSLSKRDVVASNIIRQFSDIRRFF